MIKVYDLLCEIDNIVIASPLYFSQLTGSLLNFASRLQFLYISRVIRKDEKIKLSHKKGVIILVGGGDGSPAPAMQTATTLIHQMGGKVIGNVCSLNTNTVSAKDDMLALTKIKELANLIKGG